MGFYLVLAPAVKLWLSSCQLGHPCWHILFSLFVTAGSRVDIKVTFRLYTLCAGMQVMFQSSWHDSWPITHDQQQLLVARATEQPLKFDSTHAQHCHKVSLHAILVGVMVTICKCHTEPPTSECGRCSVKLNERKEKTT